MGRTLSCTFVLSCWSAVADAQAPARPDPAVDLTQLSLAELANMKVTSVSKSEEERSRTPAAVYVITQEDIRRSGATTLAEALRLVPGIEVARIDTDHWSVGVRGFGDQFSKSVLVLIDGRSVYTPLFAGVFWAVQDTVLEDIDRIEVIRGPGGTIWGANAVNGVINVITKSAVETHGTLVSAIGGNVERVVGAVRYGAGNDRGFHYRGYVKGFDRAPQRHADGRDFDAWRALQAGGRAEWLRGESDTFTLQGDLYASEVGQSVGVATLSPPGTITADDPLDAWGGNLVARWRRVRDAGSDFQLDAYYDRTSLSAPNVKEDRHTFDLDFVHHLTLPREHQFLWGLGARLIPSTAESVVPTFSLDPPEITNRIFSAFVQDEMPLLRDRLSLTLGAKVEHNDYTGFEVQPSARLSWRVRPDHTLWAAVTRAVRTPSRLERDIRWIVTGVPSSPPLFLKVDGNPEFLSEELIGYEAGYRALVGSRLYLEISAFHNEYDELQSFGAISTTVDLAPPPPHVTLHLPYANGIEGSTHGFEAAADAKPHPRWRLKASYSFLSLSLRVKPNGTDTLEGVASYEGSSPRHGVTVQSRLDLPGRVEFDQTYRYVSDLPYRGAPAYDSLDLRLAWRFAPGFELAVVGQNLLESWHVEFEHDHDPQVVIGIRRAAYAQVVWRR
jgi:iron complex outermembrane recepter protein